MKKINLSIRLALFFIAISCIFIMCRKTENPKQIGPIKSQDVAMPATAGQIEAQLQWMARGYAELHFIHGAPFFNLLNSHLSSKIDYIDAHTDIQTKVQTQLSLDLEVEIFNSVNRIPFHNNNYDRDYFYGFFYDNCSWVVNLSIVDTPDVSKPLVFTYESILGSDSTWGYFWNTSIVPNDLDSVLLSSDNFEDYYIFLVSTGSNCSFASIRPIEGCNNNGVCEPLQGETILNCNDCKGAIQGSQKTLKIVWVRINEDKKRFDEAWAQNRYEIGWDWCIADGSPGTNGVIHHNRNNQDLEFFNKWKRRQVPIKRKSSGSLKGTVTEKSLHDSGLRAMYNKFDWVNHDIYMHFWESDNRGTFNQQQITEPSGSNITFNSSFDNLWKRKHKTGTFHQGGFGFGGIIEIPRNSSWTPETIGGKAHMVIEATSPGQNEITVKLAYEL